MAGLAKHIDPDELIQSLQVDFRTSHISRHEKHRNQGNWQSTTDHLTPYSTRYSSQASVPKFKLPARGAPGPAVAQMLRDELDLDGQPNLNLASFVGTFIEDSARKLMVENLSKNLSDADEYPAMMNMHSRCISIIADIWGAQKGEKPVGSATTGSSEAIHLGGLAMKRRWFERRQKEGKDTSKPNIIMGANAQVALEKFARYFDVEGRILPVSEESRFRLDPKLIKENLDENTIGVFVILGSTYTGHYEPVEEISNVLDEFEKETGHDIPIHVDGASGAFVAPFAEARAGFKWNFELPRVKSINTSGHKFGLCLAGVGWIIFRDQQYLPDHLKFELHYLGGCEESFTLNFSRPGAQIITQYFNLIHLGFEGYRGIMENCLNNARLLSKSLEATGWYRCVSDIHRRPGEYKFIEGQQPEPEKEGETSADYNPGLPVVSFTLSDTFKKTYPRVKQVAVSNLMRAKQYIIPNYPLPPKCDKTEILRIVVRESMSLDLLNQLITDIISVTEHLIEENNKGEGDDIAAFNPAPVPLEKAHGSSGVTHRQKHKARHGMEKGVHRSVC